MKKYNFSKVLVLCLVVGVMVGLMAMPAFASETTPVSLLDATTLQPVKDFSADAKPTILAILAITIPATMSVWAIGLGIRKGLGRLMGATRRAI